MTEGRSDMNNLVERMLREFYMPQFSEESAMSPINIEKMTAAAKVLLDAALGEIHVGDTEWKECVEPKEAGRFYMSAAEFNGIMRDRKARLLAPKTPEERVTVFDNDTHLGKDHNPLWIVHVDGENVIHLDKKFFNLKDAEIYRRGLIAELKEKAQ